MGASRVAIWLVALVWTSSAACAPVDRDASAATATGRDSDRYVERISSLQETRPAAWQGFVVALAANATVRGVFDEADAAGLSPDSPRTRSRFIAAVTWAVANGLLRADDADVVAVRPLVRKVLSSSRCVRDDTHEIAKPGRIMIDEQTAGLQDVFTRAVVAVNEQRALVPIDPAAYAAAGQRSAAGLDGDEREILESALLASRREVPTCRMLDALNKLRFDGPAADTPLMIRKALNDFTAGLREPRTYGVGEAPAYPPEALRAGVTGTQRVRFTIAVDGHLKDVTFASSAFEPAETALANGNAVRSSALFDDEIRAYLADTAAKYPPQPRDGQLADTTYELPFTWTIR